MKFLVFIFIFSLKLYSYDLEFAIKDSLWTKVINDKNRKKVAVVLSAGGPKGCVHIGFLKVLKENGMPVDLIAGNSMGAIVGSLYASGYSIKDLENAAREIGKYRLDKDFKKVNVVKLIFFEKPIKPVYIRQFIDDKLKGIKFSQLKIPFVCSAMDLYTGEEIVFRKGVVAFAVKASASIPALFEPVKYNQRYLVDGAVINFLPVSLVDAPDNWIISSVVESKEEKKLDNMLSVLMQIIDVRGNLLAEKSVKKSDYAVFHEVLNVDVYDFEKCYDLFIYSVINTQREIEKIKNLYITDTVLYETD